MTRCVLFSPLGRSDPIRGFRDGPFLHICRTYKPERVYMYLSKEICQLDELDNRYERCLEQLSQAVGFSCQSFKIKRPELQDVHLFDRFYLEFSKLLEHISKENPHCQIILNLSSGTPQMQACLHTLGHLDKRPLLMVQVDTPVKLSNTEPIAREEHDVETDWGCNEDNDPLLYTDRCRVVETPNFNSLLKREIIIKHVQSYDYQAALAVGETIPEFIPPSVFALIRSGMRRFSMDTSGARQEAKFAEFDFIAPRGCSDPRAIKRIAYEYILQLDIKVKRHEIADFLRALSPILTTLFQLYLEDKCAIDIKKYCEFGQIKRDLLTKDLVLILEKRFKKFKDTQPSAANLSLLVMDKGTPEATVLSCHLAMVEKKARHLAAHEIVKASDEWLRKQTRYEPGEMSYFRDILPKGYANIGFYTHEIWDMLKKFYELLNPVTLNEWRSYDLFNEEIIRRLQVVHP